MSTNSENTPSVLNQTQNQWSVSENDDRPKVLIAGAGIGGLTLALLLKKAGVRFQILERATEIKPLGKATVKSTPARVSFNNSPQLTSVSLSLSLSLSLSRVSPIQHTSRLGRHSGNRSGTSFDPAWYL